MCTAEWYTGAACAHRGHQPDGTPILVEEKIFFKHGVWIYNMKDTGCRKHCDPDTIQKPSYRDLTKNMEEPAYIVVDWSKLPHPDYTGDDPDAFEAFRYDTKCPLCTGRDPITGQMKNRPTGRG